jgi:glycerol-3-phosphate dehydrogenase
MAEDATIEHAATGTTEAFAAVASSPLDRRRRDLERLVGESWDLLIVGGGIVGAGALLDAATRGLKVALVEQDDIAAGTSSRSSRLVHGGLRYLQQFQVSLVREALAERARLLRLAPHLVRLEDFLFPLYGPPAITRLFYGAGLTAYDVLGSAKSGGRHRHLTTAQTLDYAPNLLRRDLRGALLYHDAMEDDARFALAVLRTALAHAPGSTLAVTRVRATGPLRDGDRVTGAVLEDRLTGEVPGDQLTGEAPGDRLTGDTLEVRASAVLDATGVWGALPDRPFGAGSFSVLPARGSHLVIPRDRIPARGGMTLRIPGRVAFLVPWPRHWVIGTTDHPFHGQLERPAASGAEVDEILGTLNGALDLELTRDDIVGTYAGLRPLIAPSDAASSVKISREHKVSVEGPGLVRVSGGKYTTYRVMARDAVDAVLGEGARGRPSGTAELPIIGAAARSDLDALATRIAARHGVGELAGRSLVDRHGTEAEAVLALGAVGDRNRTLADGFPYLEAEVAWAVEQEHALSLDDVLSRRIRLAPELRDRGAAIAPRVAAILGECLGWDEGRRAEEVTSYLDGAHREFDVPATGEPGAAA